MSQQGAYAFISPVATTDTSKPIAKRDPLLSNDNNGVRFDIDLPFSFCYPGGPFATRPVAGNPAIGATIYDVAERANGSFTMQAGEAITYDKGGFNFAPATKGGAYIAAPASATDDIWGAGTGANITCTISGGAVDSYTIVSGGANYNTEGTTDGVVQLVLTGGGGAGATATATVVGGVITAVTPGVPGSGYTSAPTVNVVPAKQNFLVCVYVTLPTEADWSTSGSAARPFFSMGNYSIAADMVTMFQFATRSLQCSRQTGPAFATGQISSAINIASGSPHFGQLAQVAAYRTNTGAGFVLRTAAGGLVSSVTATRGQESVQNWTGRQMKFGLTNDWWGTGALAGQDLNASNFKVFRAFIENLRRSQRDPLAVLDADWLRIQARIAASAAANGGTSQIFA